MTVRDTTRITDWATPGAYGSSPPGPWRRLLIIIDMKLTAIAAAQRRRAYARFRRHVRITREIPPYLRRDIGLPPLEYRPDVWNYR
jgi:hypothetical protein